MFPSMVGRAGSALDNAMAESFVASLNAETELQTGSRTFVDRPAARTDVFDYIEGFYNTRRIHSSIGNVSPADYERVLKGEVSAA